MIRSVRLTAERCADLYVCVAVQGALARLFVRSHGMHHQCAHDVEARKGRRMRATRARAKTMFRTSLQVPQKATQWLQRDNLGTDSMRNARPKPRTTKVVVWRTDT
eukprot:scaffold11437_cov75-Phaeocystis_antarctica.AAC.5